MIPVTGTATRRRRRHRLRQVVAAALVAALVAALGGCGFDYATDRVNTIGPGVSDRSAGVDVLGAVVVAAQDDAGVFLATLANNSAEEPARLVGLGGGAADEVRPATGPALDLPVAAADRVVLVDRGGIPVAGDFTVGDFVTTSLTFDSGETVTLDVPVVKPCYQYAPDALALQLPGGPPPPDRFADEPTPDRDGEFADTEEGRHPDPYSCVVEQAELPVHGTDEASR